MSESQVAKVSFYPPRDFEVKSVKPSDVVIEVVPAVVGRNVYTTVGHVVVNMHDGVRRAGKIEVHPETGEMRIVRLDKRPGGGEGRAANLNNVNPDRPYNPNVPETAKAQAQAQAQARPPDPAGDGKKDPLAKQSGGVK